MPRPYAKDGPQFLVKLDSTSASLGKNPMRRPAHIQMGAVQGIAQVRCSELHVTLHRGATTAPGPYLSCSGMLA